MSCLDQADSKNQALSQLVVAITAAPSVITIVGSIQGVVGAQCVPRKHSEGDDVDGSPLVLDVTFFPSLKQLA